MKLIPTVATRFVGRQKLRLQTNSPTLLLAAGITGVIGTTVLASRATLKAQPVWEATALELDRIEYEASKMQDVRVSESDQRKARVAVYFDTAVQIGKLYGPAIVLGSISIGSLVYSHKILNDRYSNLAAAYVSLQEVLDRYRQRVRDEVGNDKERDIFYDARETTVIEMGPNGPKKKTVKSFGPEGGTQYARLFGPSNPNWKTTPEYNTMFLRQVQEHCNRILRSQGYMFLNRVYEELGLDATESGATTGWLYERGTGDNFIDFGVWDEDMKDRLYDFMVGNEGEIMLDFNVDGDIHNRLHLPKLQNY